MSDAAGGGTFASGRRRRFENFAGPFFQPAVFHLVVYGVQRVESVVVFLRFEHVAQSYEFPDALFVRHRDQDVFVLMFGAFVVFADPFDGDVVSAALSGEGRNGAGGQDHQDRAVQHALAQQTDRFSVGCLADDDVVAHHYGCERGGYVGAAQAEDDRPLVAGEFERFLSEQRGDVFGGGDQDDHHGSDLDALPVAEEGPVVDQHAYADQKEGDEDGVADEFDAVHQGRGARDEAVEGQTREEGADDRLQSGQMCQVGAQEDHDQHENVLGDVVAAMLEEPVPDQREEQHDECDAEHDRDAEPVPEHVVRVSGDHAYYDRQQQQGQRIGNDRASDGDRDGFVAGDAQFADDGVGDQGLRGEESGQQDRGVDRKSQDVISRQNTEQERNTERIESEYEASGAVLAEIRHVHIQAGEEHDVEQSGRTGEDDAAVAQHQVEAVRSDHRTGDDKPQQVGNFQLVEQQGSGEDDDQNQQEFENRILEREGYAGE